jgi:hypothetical protein
VPLDADDIAESRPGPLAGITIVDLTTVVLARSRRKFSAISAPM